MVKPLEGVRVLDLTRFVSGAYCTMLLAGLGAEVVKVEGLPGGDPYRAQGAVRVGEQSALFAALNSGKRSVAVDLRSPEGARVVRELAAHCDVLVENGRPGSLAKLGLDAATLREAYPQLVYASVSGYGQAGPDAALGGFDLILQAAGGLMSVTGFADGGPVKVGAPVLDIGSGLAAVAAILAGLLGRAADGRGRTVGSSLFQFALGCLTSYGTQALATGVSPGRLGNDSPQFAPYGVFRCRDGALAVAGTGSEKLWQRLCGVLGHPQWTGDPRYRANCDRVAHRVELTCDIEAVLQGESTRFWLRRLEAADVPAALVADPYTALTSPQAAALGMLQPLFTPDGTPYMTVTPPLDTGDDLTYPRGVPSLGQHTEEVLREFGVNGEARVMTPPSPGPAQHGQRAGRPADSGVAAAGVGAAGTTAPHAFAPEVMAREEAVPGVAAGDASALAELVVRRTVALSAVPAPPLEEEQRAGIVREWWRADGMREVEVDAAGNVRALLRAGEAGRRAVVVCAHLDTVFGPEVAHGAVRRGSRLTGPGVGDDTVAVCALSALDRLLPAELRTPVWLVATIGEEGLGNLAGVRALLADPPAPLGAMIAVEGDYLGRVTTTAVGSVRWRVGVTSGGGHAWEDAAAPSAVHTAARLVTRLSDLADPAGTPRIAVNVGTFHGGESVNSRATGATFLLDLRSEDPDALAVLTRRARAILAEAGAQPQVSVEVIGERPAGRLPEDHDLVRAAWSALLDVGVTPVFHAASTDANAALAAGLPAVTLGVTTGDGTHTEAEWIDVEPVADGLRALAATLIRLDEKEW
jgi:crotonobetainyl-CoA:carnitine CoA-transferase CaiB-like acyl-CoA transferase/acetylornithine deacetylase/succinyl-diaminopimelate desuccinylase-like protein